MAASILMSDVKFSIARNVFLPSAVYVRFSIYEFS